MKGVPDGASFSFIGKIKLKGGFMDREEFFKQLVVNDSEMKEFLQIHPKQLISSEVKVPVWQIKYSYLTARNNEKTSIKYILAAESDYDIVEVEFWEYIKAINENLPYRAISNVEILDIDYMGECFIELE